MAVGLAMDAFAVAVGSTIAYRRISYRYIFRLGFHFGLFQAIMPIIGWYVGSSFHRYIHRWDHWIAFGLLTLIGLKAIREALSSGRNEIARSDPSRGLSLIFLSLATSMDALAVGISLAILNIEIWYPSIVIGVITAGLTVLGILLAERIGAVFSKKFEIAGGVVLLAIGIKILFDHM